MSDKHFDDFLAGEFGHTSLVAELDGQVVGTMDFIEEKQRIGISGELPSFQRKGIGSTLFYHLLKIMQERGLKEAIADTGITQTDTIRFHFSLMFSSSIRHFLSFRY